MTKQLNRVLLVLCLLTCWLSLNVLAAGRAYLQNVPASPAAVTPCVAWPADDCADRVDCVDL